MKWFNKALKRFGFVSKREADVNFRRGYQAARASRMNSDWVLGYEKAADGDIKNDLTIIRERARNLAKNNTVAKKYLRMVKNNVVGPSGFILQNKSKDVNGKLDKGANTAIELAFKEWSKRENCTIQANMTFRQLMGLLVVSVARDGEIFVRKVYTNSNKFGFTLQLIEPDLIDERYNEELSNGNVIRLGIEYDKFRTPVAYHIYNPKGNSDLYNSVVTQRVRIPAKDIYHLYDIERAYQSRGISHFAPVSDSLRQHGGFMGAAVINARIGASKGGFFYSERDDSAAFAGETDTAGDFVDGVEPGEMNVLPSGWKFQPYDPAFPSEGMADFVKVILREIAAGLGVSYNTLANDLEGVNFTSIRAGLLDERDYWMDLQAWFIDSFLSPLFSDWLIMALTMGAVRVGPTPLPLSKYEKFNSPVWIGKRWAWVRPAEDVEANKLAVDYGFKTNAQVVAEQGGDFEEVIEQLAEEQARIKELNVEISRAKNDRKDFYLDESTGGSTGSAGREQDGHILSVV